MISLSDSSLLVYRDATDFCLFCILKQPNSLMSRLQFSCSVVSDSLQPHGPQHARLPWPWNYPGKNTRVGCHFLLQGIFPTQGLNPGLLHCRHILYLLSHQGNPEKSFRALKSSRNLHSICFISVFICLNFEQTEAGNPMQSTRGTVYIRKTAQNSNQNYT